MKKVLRLIYIILIIIFLKLVITFCVNKVFISNYNDGKYNKFLGKSMLLLNISEPYIAHYNYGNLLYKNNQFQEAIKEYEKALKLFPLKFKKCSIRINLTLAMLTEVDEENKSKEENIEILKEARDVLCEDGCANKTNNEGHSENAERLKKEIDNLIEKLENQEENNDENKDDEDTKDEEKKEDNKKETDGKEEKLKEIQSQAIQERQQDLENYDIKNNYEYYGGKKW